MTTYAICSDRTANRATVIALYPSESAVRGRLQYLGAQRLDICAVAIERDDVEIGERIWHGPQSIGVTRVYP